MGGGVYAIVGCLARLTSEYASLSRCSTKEGMGGDWGTRTRLNISGYALEIEGVFRFAARGWRGGI